MGAGSGSAEFLGKSPVKPSPKAPLSSQPGHLLRQLPQVPKEAPRARRRTGVEVTRRCSVDDLGMGFTAGAARPRQGLPRQLDPGSTEALRSTAQDCITWPRPRGRASRAGCSLEKHPRESGKQGSPGPGGRGRIWVGSKQSWWGLLSPTTPRKGRGAPCREQGREVPSAPAAHPEPRAACSCPPLPSCSGQGRDLPAVCSVPRDQGCPTLARQHGMLQLCIPVQRGGGGEWPPPGQGARGCSRDLMDEPEV